MPWDSFLKICAIVNYVIHNVQKGTAIFFEIRFVVTYSSIMAEAASRSIHRI